MYPDPFDGVEGVGIESDPYLIYNKDQLSKVRDSINNINNTNKGGRDCFYKLAADIELECEEWTPIGSGVPFYGTFDGGGHTITFHFTVDGDLDEPMGLFGTNNGTVKNLDISDDSSIDVTVTVHRAVGVIAGENAGTIENCRNGGTVSDKVSESHSSYAFGGIAGFNAGTITNCYNTGSISGTHSGGIAGDNHDAGTITNCYNTGSISGEPPAASWGIIAARSQTVITSTPTAEWHRGR